uniref:Uncharacterized protein n=1 Tax=Oryza sativa subsp. japonica TaxID=39947 RepID=Q60DK6_ORYSJ|nr:hypothetical protein LOC_Os03g43310 [Oryza sativa Japonica Group]
MSNPAQEHSLAVARPDHHAAVYPMDGLPALTRAAAAPRATNANGSRRCPPLQPLGLPAPTAPKAPSADGSRWAAAILRRPQHRQRDSVAYALPPPRRHCPSRWSALAAAWPDLGAGGGEEETSWGERKLGSGQRPRCHCPRRCTDVRELALAVARQWRGGRKPAAARDGVATRVARESDVGALCFSIL